MSGDEEVNNEEPAAAVKEEAPPLESSSPDDTSLKQVATSSTAGTAAISDHNHPRRRNRIVLIAVSVLIAVAVATTVGALVAIFLTQDNNDAPAPSPSTSGAADGTPPTEETSSAADMNAAPSPSSTVQEPPPSAESMPVMADSPPVTPPTIGDDESVMMPMSSSVVEPTELPTSTAIMTTEAPIQSPATKAPTEEPSQFSSAAPSNGDVEVIDPDAITTTFYAIGDVPYTEFQQETLRLQLQRLPDDAEFVIHVGDLRDENGPCVPQDYATASQIFQLSHAPVFVILGDNDWNDCQEPEEGLAFWMDEFLGFESRYWANHTTMKTIGSLTRHPDIPEIFSFQHKGTLFIGLRIVGGPVYPDVGTWSESQEKQFEWSRDLIKSYHQAESGAGRVGRVAIFSHANPGRIHNWFFDPLVRFIEFELQNELPILHLNGDRHKWVYEPSFLNQTSILRIMLTGRTFEPPLKMTIAATGEDITPEEAFVYDRRLNLTF